MVGVVVSLGRVRSGLGPGPPVVVVGPPVVVVIASSVVVVVPSPSVIVVGVVASVPAIVIVPSPAVVSSRISVGALTREVSFLLALEASPGASLLPIAAGSSSGPIVVPVPGTSQVALDPLAAHVLPTGLRDCPIGMVHLVVSHKGEGEGILGLDVDVLDLAEGVKDLAEIVLLGVDVETHHVHLGLLHCFVRHLQYLEYFEPAYKQQTELQKQRQNV